MNAMLKIKKAATPSGIIILSVRAAVCLCFLCCAGGILLPQPAFCEEITPRENIPDIQSANSENCLVCHGDPSADKFIDPVKFRASIHGNHLCTSCHIDITDVPHDIPLKPVSCSTCHHTETKIYLNSDHGIAVKAGVDEAASCKDCHGNAHELLNSRNPDSLVSRKNIPTTCAQCHGHVKEMEKYHLSQSAPIESYNKNVHGLALSEDRNISAAVCTDCHGSHDLHRATNPASKMYWKNIPTTCGRCHENVYITYSRSVHGAALAEGKRDAPVCTDCHGEHSIEAVKLATSKVFASHIPETCGQCHKSERITTKYSLPEDSVKTYMKSYHGLALQLGSVVTANCASCHGTHDILPFNNPLSSIHPSNLAKTCGKCHAGVNSQVTKGQIHSGTLLSQKNLFGTSIISFVRHFYIVLILVVIGGMLLHNGFDFFRKCQKHYRMQEEAAHPERMGLNERIQHGILAISFLVLAYTGFAHKFPHAWWASPFVGRIEWRSLGHRIAALIFCLLAIYHVFYLFLTKNGKQEFKALLPRKTDYIHFLKTIAYLRGKRSKPPLATHYDYAAKIEYWALVWGTFIMVLTGALMLREGWFLSHFPKWLFDVISTIHYYEAVLACLAILIWHGYFVMFDPDIYPMKWTWLTGRSSPAHPPKDKNE